MSPPPPLLPSPPLLLPPPPPQPLVTSEDESRNKLDSKNIDESDLDVEESKEESDEDVEELEEEWMNEEDSDSVCSEPLSPRSDDSYDNPSIEESDEDVEELEEEWVNEEDSDSVCSEPLSPRSNDSYDNPSIEESDEDVEELEEECLNEEDSDSVCSEPLSPRLDDSYDNPSIEELIEELYTPILPGEEKKDREFWKRYFQQVRESEGFDIRDYPGFCRLATVHPNILKGPANFEMLKGYAREALGQYNEKNDTKYEVKDILKVNGSGCKDINFFITFTVTNGEKEYFQAKVVRHLDQSLDFPIIRPRVKEGRDI